MPTFRGFPAGAVRVTPVPDLFFSELLAAIDDLGELKVTLALVWRLARQAPPACLSRAELAGAAGLDAAAVDAALARAAARGTVLALGARNPHGESERFYFLNDARGRRDIQQVRRGTLRLKRGAAPHEPPSAPKPNVFALYEQHIGMLTPLMAETLQEVAPQYPEAWIAEAFAQAVRYNKRSWRYVEAILKRWQSDGRKPEPPRKPSSARPLKPAR